MGYWGLAAVVPALLALLTAVGSWIALQQMLIARTKLNNDLFDRPDHRHRLRTVRPYDYQDAATLLMDFWREVDALLRERGVFK